MKLVLAMCVFATSMGLAVIAQIPGTEEVIRSASSTSWEALLLTVIILSGLGAIVTALFRFSSIAGAAVRDYVSTTAETSRQLSQLVLNLGKTMENDVAIGIDTLKAVGHVLVVVEKTNKTTSDMHTDHAMSVKTQDEILRMLHILVEKKDVK